MSIVIDDHAMWVSTIAQLVREGITFDAVADDLGFRIILTGGY